MPTTPQLPPLALALLGLVAATAGAGEVFRTVDASGRPIYTDKPAVLPAERLKIASGSTDKVAVQQRSAEELQRLNAAGDAALASQQQARAVQKAADLSAEDKGKRCIEARSRYEQYMISQALYQTDPDSGERRYLTDTEIDAAREHSRKLVDEFCGN
jgi:hypothetical protein